MHLGMTPALIQAVRWIMSIKINRKVVTHSGRLIDKIYLNGVGWRGIRQRKTFWPVKQPLPISTPKV